MLSPSTQFEVRANAAPVFREVLGEWDAAHFQAMFSIWFGNFQWYGGFCAQSPACAAALDLRQVECALTHVPAMLDQLIAKLLFDMGSTNTKPRHGSTTSIARWQRSRPARTTGSKNEFNK